LALFRYRSLALFRYRSLALFRYRSSALFRYRFLALSMTLFFYNPIVLSCIIVLITQIINLSDLVVDTASTIVPMIIILKTKNNQWTEMQYTLRSGFWIRYIYFFQYDAMNHAIECEDEKKMKKSKNRQNHRVIVIRNI
jgi:hypothetical protein